MEARDRRQLVPVGEMALLDLQGEEEGESGAKCSGLGQFWEKNL